MAQKLIYISEWDIYILSKELKYDSEHTFLERIIQEVGVAK